MAALRRPPVLAPTVEHDARHWERGVTGERRTGPPTLRGACSEGFTQDFEQRMSDDALARFLHPEIEWVPVTESLLAVDSYHGFDGVRRFWGEFLSAWERYRVETLRFDDAGHQVRPRWPGRPRRILCRPRRGAPSRRVAALGGAGSAALRDEQRGGRGRSPSTESSGLRIASCVSPCLGGSCCEPGRQRRWATTGSAPVHPQVNWRTRVRSPLALLESASSLRSGLG